MKKYRVKESWYGKVYNDSKGKIVLSKKTTHSQIKRLILSLPQAIEEYYVEKKQKPKSEGEE